MLGSRFWRLFLYGMMLISLVLSPLTPLFPTPIAKGKVQRGPTFAAELYRTQITIRNPNDWQRLDEWRVVVLEQGADWALVLVDEEQLERLARLRFEPRSSDALSALVSAHAEAYPGLVSSLQPLLKILENESNSRSSITLRSALDALTSEQRASLAQVSNLDDDADGLTNSEEAWWCTDPLNPNSDGDALGHTDGQEVMALLDFTLPRNQRWGYGPPFGPPNAWPDWNGDDNNPDTLACNDGDRDTIPDQAEAFVVGSNVLKESTDGDKFDDGQEFFGVTYCPGSSVSCGYGNYPRSEYSNYIQATMPDWVKAPGDNLFVAAFPVPEVSVVPGSWKVDRVTTITTEEGQMTQTTNSYETSVTQGQSTSVANTVTWNEWEEVSQSVETPLAMTSQHTRSASRPPSFWAGAKILGGGLAIGAGCGLGIALTLAYGVTCGAGLTSGLVSLDEGWEEWNKDDIQDQQNINKYKITNINDVSASASANASVILNQNFDTQGIANSLDGVQYAINQQGALLARGLYDISYAISQPRLTETRTNGRSWGGAQTTTHTVYEEHTVTEGEAFTTGQNWSTAWAVDSSHAADLSFNYTVENVGTEYARELTGLIFNIYLGDDTTPIISYLAWQQFPNGKLENLFPDRSNTFASDTIPLTLEQMKRIDLGERLTVVLEDFSYGADELFYQDAINGGVTFFIEDGVHDGDELVDSYVIPTWGTESVQDVLTRYFPAGYDAEGEVNALWTPEFNGTNSPTWNEHYLSDMSWWNVYLTQADAGNTALKARKRVLGCFSASIAILIEMAIRIVLSFAMARIKTILLRTRNQKCWRVMWPVVMAMRSRSSWCWKIAAPLTRTALMR